MTIPELLPLLRGLPKDAPGHIRADAAVELLVAIQAAWVAYVKSLTQTGGDDSELERLITGDSEHGYMPFVEKWDAEQ